MAEYGRFISSSGSVCLFSRTSDGHSFLAERKCKSLARCHSDFKFLSPVNINWAEHNTCTAFSQALQHH